MPMIICSAALIGISIFSDLLSNLFVDALANRNQPASGGVWVVPPTSGKSIRSTSAALRYESCAPMVPSVIVDCLPSCPAHSTMMFQRMFPPGWSQAPANHKGGSSVKTPKFFPVPFKSWISPGACVYDLSAVRHLGLGSTPTAHVCQR
jgi:hypothetical protein